MKNGVCIDMEGVKSIIEFCGLLGITILCIILSVSCILRWIRPSQTRIKRLNIITGIVIFLFCSTIGVHYVITDPQGSARKAETIVFIFVNAIKGTIGLLMFGIIAASIIIMIFVVILCLYKCLCIIFRNKRNTDNIDENSETNVLVNKVKNPIVIVVLVWGIMALFLILPFLIGEQINDDPIQTWVNGVYKIERLFDLDENKSKQQEFVVDFSLNNASNDVTQFSFKILAAYTLIYIIVLGIGIAIIKILYSIIKHTLEKSEDKSLLDEYSSPIALLSVGVALLWTIRNGDLPKEDFGETIIALFKSFATVIIIVALAILTLEIIRLLMDMREKIIRKEARYLFISLVGQVAILILNMLNSIYNGIKSAIDGGTRDTGLRQIGEKLEEKIIQTMDAEIDNSENPSTTFSPFNEKITKK